MEHVRRMAHLSLEAGARKSHIVKEISLCIKRQVRLMGLGKQFIKV